MACITETYKTINETNTLQQISFYLKWQQIKTLEVASSAGNIIKKEDNYPNKINSLINDGNYITMW